MATNDLQFPVPSEGQFEEQMLALANAVFKPELPAQFVGRRGQDQKGLDIILQAPDGRWVGIQCKRYVKTKLTAAIVQADLDSAHDVTPPLSLFIVAARSDRDEKLQESVRSMTLHGKAGAVAVWSWPDLVVLLEQHDLLSSLLVGIAPKHLLKAAESQLGPLLFASTVTSAQTAETDPQWLRDATRLLSRSKPDSALKLLGTISPTASDAAAHLTLVLRCYLGLGRFKEVVGAVRAASTPNAVHLAFGAFAAARDGDNELSDQWLERAKASASSGERAQVWALHVSVSALRKVRTFDDVLQGLPQDLLNSREVSQSLGDLATSQDRELDAIAWYDRAEALEPGASIPRQLKIASAKIALAFSHTPLGSPRAVHETDLRLAEAGRASLTALYHGIDDIEDPQARTALLNNLAVAEVLTGNFATAANRAADAVRQNESDIEMWHRYLALIMSTQQPLDDTLASSIPDDGDLHLRVALIHRLQSRPEAAVASLERARALGAAEDATDAELYRISNPGSVSESKAADLAAKLSAGNAAIPAAVLALEHIDDPSMEPYRAQILARVQEMSSDETLPLEGRFVLAAMLRDSGLQEATAFLPILESMLHRGGQFDPSVADVLVAVLLLGSRLHRATDVASIWLDLYPSDVQAIAANVNVLSARGLYGQAWSVLGEAIGRGIATPSVLENYARISFTTGQLRAGARLVKNATLPDMPGPSAFRKVFHALSVFRDPRIKTLLTDGLKQGRIDQSNAAALFGIGVQRLRAPAEEAIGQNMLVRVVANASIERTIWIGPSPSPLPGIVQVLPSAWASCLLGLKVGDEATPVSGPLLGKKLTVAEVASPAHVFMKASRDVAVGVGLADGGMDEIAAKSPEDLVEQMRTAIAADDAHRTNVLAKASEWHAPSSFVARVLRRPVRAFLSRSGTWRPSSHSGTVEARASDDAAINAAIRFVVDPVAVLTIVQAKMEEIVLAFGTPAITARTIAQLRQHYLEERDTLRAAGTAYVNQQGKLRLHEVDSRQRADHRLFWGRVWTFCKLCEVSECESDDVLASTSKYENVLGDGFAATFAVAAEKGWTVLSEEKGIRDLASEAGASAASLQRLTTAFLERNPTRRTKATTSLVLLAEMGGVFISISMGFLKAALDLPAAERKRAVRALLSTLQTADASALPIVFGFYGYAIDRAERGLPSISRSWLVKEITKSMPDTLRAPGAQRALREFLRTTFLGRRFRRLRRSVLGRGARK